MKIRTILEADKSLKLARLDLQRCVWAQGIRDRAPQFYELHDRQDLLKFYMSQWPNLASDPKHRQLWSDQLDLAVDNINEYIEKVEEWKKKKIGTPRCVLPKKKQREMGLLPSVEQEIAIREGRI